MGKTTKEIASQGKTWTQAVTQAQQVENLPQNGERVAILGCGTSWFMGQSYAVSRESAGLGETDVFIPTEMPPRHYDRVILLSRSGTTTEMVIAAREMKERGIPTVLITAVADGPIDADSEIVLAYADEESVVQTRFATSALTLMRAALGIDVSTQLADFEKAMAVELPERWSAAEQITFLGTGWTIGIANEAALKNREASQSWTEAYPAMDYRHGPMSIAQPNRLVWFFGEYPKGMPEDVTNLGAEAIALELDPMAQLVVAQRLAVQRAAFRGLNPDTPRNLTRAVLLQDE